MAELKTKRTNSSVTAFMDQVSDESRRKDCQTLVRIMKKATKAEPKMWGPSIVGFGDYRYKYASGRENDWFLVGFSPRKQDLTLYIMAGFDKHDALMSKLGKYKTGKSCLYIKRLSDVDTSVLQDLIATSIRHLKKDA
jgi:Domain of unknown function (DU1801)